MLGRNEAITLVKDRLFPAWDTQRGQLDRIDCWYRWQHEDISLPRSATAELRALAKMSKVPWLQLVVTAAAQAMYVDGYRSRLDGAHQTDASDSTADGAAADSETVDSPPWQAWLANQMDRRQVALHRAMLAYGYAFTTVLPGTDPLTGADQAVIRGVSPRKMVALYDDPAEDDWPQYALRIVERKGDDHLVRLYDDEAVYELRLSGSGRDVTLLSEPAAHGAGVCPVIRYANMLDLDGRTPGEVEPFIAIAARINKTSYDRMLVQHFNSWKIRYVTGMAEPDTEEDANRTKMKLRQDDLLIAEDPDTKFGQLDETSLGGFIDAHRADIETLAAASQTPTHELTGQMANLSAEALAAARASLTQKITERQKSAGASHAQTLKLAAALDGHSDYAKDISGRVTWQDMEIRSMSQSADALVKLSGLGIPFKALWGKIPGIEKSDVDEWAEMAADGDPIRKMQLELERQYKDAGNSGGADSSLGGPDTPTTEQIAKP
jgi:hypothetical protein